MFYQNKIRETVSALGKIGVEPRHVEAWMRVEHPTLDHLAPKQFREAVALAIESTEVGGADMSEKLARSFGL